MRSVIALGKIPFTQIRKLVRFTFFSIIFLLLVVCYAFAFNRDSLPAKNIYNFKLASILQSNMVIQQAKPFKVWGSAKPGSKIRVKADWAKAVEAKTGIDGKWITSLKVPSVKAGEFCAHLITISNEGEHIELNNVLIGEVWICSGQSNMDLSMKPFPPYHDGVVDNKKEIAEANYPGIRFYRQKKETATELRDTCNGSWEACTPLSAAEFSGVAYYFGRTLLNKLKIPIGLVQSAYGSAACQAFISRETLASDPVLKSRYLDPYDANRESKIPVLRPTLIFNAMIHPLIPLSVKGFLWYQGESNAGEYDIYPRLCKALIESWRKEFKQGDLPFYIVQMTPYNWNRHDPAEDGYAKFREAQAAVLQLKNTGIAVTMDVGDTGKIHSPHKKLVAERLAALALHNNYGFSDMACAGPLFEKLIINIDTLRVIYKKESIGTGLETKDGMAPRHFYIAGIDKVFKEAFARIEGNEIWLYNVSVSGPVAVRYAFTNYPVTNFQNKNGFAAYPFRTDQWNEKKVITKKDNDNN